MATPYTDRSAALTGLGTVLRDVTGLGADKVDKDDLNDQVDKLVEAIALLGKGYIYGLSISNNGTDSDHDIDIAAGTAMSEDGNLEWLNVASGLTKRIDATWAVGTASGGLFTGTVANNTWYHVFVIRKTSDGSVDAGFDTSLTAANIPTGYVEYRRIGSVLTDGSANIRAFVQSGDHFLLSVPVQDYSASNPGTSAVTPTLSVPPSADAIIDITIRDDTPTVGDTYCLVTSPAQTDSTPSSSLFSLSMPGGVGLTVRTESARMEVMANSSRQIRFRMDRSDADISVKILTLGWNDHRGR